MSKNEKQLPEIIKTVNIDDREYTLLARQCGKCSRDHLEIWRWSGPSFSCYKMPLDFEVDDFEDFIQVIDEQLLMDAPDLMSEFHEALSEVNSASGLVADYSFAFRLLEYGRLRASSLKKQGFLDALITKNDQLSPHEQAIRTAFELGVATAEHRLMRLFEDYIHDGIAVSEWRDEGLPKARAERLRQGKRTRNAILDAAKALYAKNPELVRNDSETARQILKLRLPELQKGNGQQIGFDAITRHLRDARSCNWE